MWDKQVRIQFGIFEFKIPVSHPHRDTEKCVLVSLDGVLSEHWIFVYPNNF